VHWVGCQHRANRRAADDKQFRRLKEHSDVALFHEVSRNNTGEDKKNSAD
jgi:hypothetical protein